MQNVRFPLKMMVVQRKRFLAGGGGLKGKEMKEGISDKHTHNNCTSLSFLCSENSDTPLKSETLSGYINRQPDDIPSLT